MRTRSALAVAVPAWLGGSAWAADAGRAAPDLTSEPLAIAALAVFGIGYFLVMIEDVIHVRKSKPVLMGAGLIWILICVLYMQRGLTGAAEDFKHHLLEFAELMLFLLVAMTYINAIDSRGAFSALRDWMIRRGLTYRQLFWATGAVAFMLSPIADNLTTALVMGAVAVKLGADAPRFISLACINVVVAANAGGAFSPFGDITTLMIWQAGHAAFFDFFALFLPSLVNFLIPAAVLSLAVPAGRPAPGAEQARLSKGAMPIMILFLLTIASAVAANSLFGLPPVFGMMLGFGYLQAYGQIELVGLKRANSETGDMIDSHGATARAEWDTLFFFYGVVLGVGGLAFLGYLDHLSHFLYGGFGPTVANIAIGVLSAVFDNIPLVFAVLSMHPEMGLDQWLLITLTAGVGGSLLSIGSAAGVALMGTARGHYTFLAHLKWSWAIALGYAASIGVHLALN